MQMTAVALPADRNVAQKEAGTKLKCKRLCAEIQGTCNMKCVIVHAVITGATGTVTRGSRKGLEATPGRHSVDSLQKAAVLGTSHTQCVQHCRLKLEASAVRVAAGSGGEVPGRNGLWQETPLPPTVIMTRSVRINAQAPQHKCLLYGHYRDKQVQHKNGTNTQKQNTNRQNKQNTAGKRQYENTRAKLL
jgi:hypothetical protein